MQITNVTMKDRILLLIDHYKLSSAQFAESIGVQRSSISHILSGRNNPSYDFLIKTLEYFSEISAEWLLLGKGPMLKALTYQTKEEKSNPNQNVDLFSQLKTTKEPEENSSKDNNTKEKRISDELVDLNSKPKITNVNSSNTSVERIILLYDDDTFEIIQRK